MYICLCKCVTEADIQEEVSRGDVVCMRSLCERLGASTGCGCCADAARECLEEALARKRLAGAADGHHECETGLPSAAGGGTARPEAVSPGVPRTYPRADLTFRNP